MSSYEGMNRLAQLAGEMDTATSHHSYNQPNGIDNLGFTSNPDENDMTEIQHNNHQPNNSQQHYSSSGSNMNQIMNNNTGTTNQTMSSQQLNSMQNSNFQANANYSSNNSGSHGHSNQNINIPNGHLNHPHANSQAVSTDQVQLKIQSSHSHTKPNKYTNLSSNSNEPLTLPPLNDLTSALNSLNFLKNQVPEIDDIEDEINCLTEILNRNEFNETLQLYNSTVTNWNSPLGVVTAPSEERDGQVVSNLTQGGPHSLNRHASFKQHIEPLTSATDRLVNEVRNNLSIVHQNEAQHLLSLLYAPHFQVLFPTHDEVALMREGDMNENNIVDISRNPDDLNDNVNGVTSEGEDEVDENGIISRNIGGSWVGGFLDFIF